MTIKPTLAKYCPEDIPGAHVVNLVANIPYAVEAISRFSKISGDYLVSLIAYSVAGNVNVSFYVNTDGTFKIIDSQSFACYHLESDEAVSVSAKTTLAVSLSSGVNVANYPVRYVIRITRPSVIEKLLLGISLTDEETPINNMFNLGEMLLSGEYPVKHRLLVSRKQIARTITAAAGTQQIGETITVPKNRYVVLDEIAVDGYEAGVTDNFIRVDRDLDDEYVKLNCYALAPFVTDVLPDIPLSYPFKIGIPAVDKLAIYLENGSPVATWRARYKYSIYVLTIPDKIRWGIQLTPSEEDIAKSKNLYNKVKAGLV